MYLLSQIDIGQGYKPPGYYVQHSYGLFPAPWPQDCPELSSVCHLFELLGLFIAKCIQDGRRVDLPLSKPFFKLMCMPGTVQPGVDFTDSFTDTAGMQSERSDTESPCNDFQSSSSSFDNNSENTNSANNPEEQQPDSSAHSNQRARPQTPHPINSGSGIWPDGASPKEAEVLLLDEIPKDKSCKNDVLTLQELEDSEGSCLTSEIPWFAGILDRTDLSEINPYQGNFLKQLDKVVAQRETIKHDETLTVKDKERLLGEITLPGGQENLPGTKLENLW